MDNEELGRRITGVVHDTELRLSRDIARLEGVLESHRTDPYAHRQMVATYEAQQRDWMAWRNSMSNWRAYLTGAIAVITAAVAVGGTLIVQHVGFH